jgi:beta-lactamase class A
MTPSRRQILTALLATGASLELAACGGRANPRTTAGGLDANRLGGQFSSLSERATPGQFDLGVMTFAPLSVWCADENRRYPMQAVVVAPIIAAALAEVDAGRLRLNERVRVRAVDLSPPPSRINQTFPAAGFIDLPAADLIALAVQAGDNTAADVVMGRIGGPGAVTAWLRSHGIVDMRVDRYMRELQPALYGLTSFRPAWQGEDRWMAARGAVPPEDREAAVGDYLADPRDTTTLQAALSFLNQLAAGELLSKSSTALLLRLMSADPKGDDNLGGGLGAGLPAGAAWAHKGGGTPTDLGLTPVTNDMGIISLADGRRFAVAAFLAGSTSTAAQRNALFADAARLAVAALR